MILAVGGLAVAVWATIGTNPDVSGVLSTLLGWITGAVAIGTGWLWLTSYGDRWQLPFAATGLLIAIGTLASAMMGEIPKILLLVPVYALALWLAVHLERNRIAQWHQQQMVNREGTFTPERMRDDPLIETRNNTRFDDASATYPATLRELKARLRKLDGDPWA